ncbi:MAG TPA: hypothetical protein VFO21_12715 [Vicinamibacterales bacterium]|nr:hypothetical protein [Vicinamibacterales bacterium]
MRLLIGMLMSGLVAAQAPAGPLVFGPQAAWFRPADAEESHAPSRPTADDPGARTPRGDVDGCG